LSIVLKSLGYGSASVFVKEADNRIELSIQGAEAIALFGKQNAAARTEVLESLQFLCGKVLFGSDSRNKLVVIDVDGFRASRESVVSKAAQRVADAVLDSGRTIRFAGMNSIDRRAFHKTLGDLEGVRTESDGEGILRRLRAFGGRRGPQGTDAPDRSEG